MFDDEDNVDGDGERLKRGRRVVKLGRTIITDKDDDNDDAEHYWPFWGEQLVFFFAEHGLSYQWGCQDEDSETSAVWDFSPNNIVGMLQLKTHNSNNNKTYVRGQPVENTEKNLVLTQLPLAKLTLIHIRSPFYKK